MKKDFCNEPELITREARWLMFFDKSKLSYNANYNGEFPPVTEYLFKVRVNTHKTINRRVRHDSEQYNRFIKINIKNDFYPINSADIEELQQYVKRNAYVVVLISNDDMQVFGNNREPMGFRIDDRVKDNGSGDDVYEVIVEGETTVLPGREKLIEEIKNQYFRVLLYGNPII